MKRLSTTAIALMMGSSVTAYAQTTSKGGMEADMVLLPKSSAFWCLTRPMKALWKPMQSSATLASCYLSARRRKTRSLAKLS